MKRKVRITLLFVVLFVLTASALFAAAPTFTTANISAVPGSGSLGIGSQITITVVDVNNITTPANQFTAAAVNLSQFGGPDSLAMAKVSNAPGQGQWRATYSVQLGTIDNVSNRKFSVTAYNADGNLTVQNPTGYTVDNVPSMDNTDFTGTLRLRINDSNTAELMKVGDTVYLFANFKAYIDSVWVNWGATFNGAPEVGYKVVGGVLQAAYTPASGTLIGGYNADLSITISKLKSITNGAAGPYTSAPGYTRVVSKNQGGFPIAADLNPPNIMGAWDLYYNNMSPLRFSPSTALVDGYNTNPSTFDIYLRLPDFAQLGGSTEFTLKFVSENRLEFTKTYSILDSPATITQLGSGVLRVTWDGKNDSGQIVNPTAVTTMGITLIDVKDYVGNSASLTQIPGGEFSATADMNIAANHALIHQGGGLAHVGATIQNRIHVVVDNVAPAFVTGQNLQLVDATDATLVRMINDVNNNGAWDAGEQVFYNTNTNAVADQFVPFKFQTERFYTVDSNSLRHEGQKYWVIAERAGTPTTKWYWTGSVWAPIALFDQTTDPLSIVFATNPDGSGSAISAEVLNTLDLGNTSSTQFTGAVAPGTGYTLTAWVQDNAGNIVKSAVVNLNITHVYMQIPIASGVAITSTHASGTGGLPATTTGVKNFYLTSTYDATDAPYTGNYYVTPDNLTFEIQVNNRNYLRATNSVELRFTQLGIAAPVIKYLNRADFGADNKATITIPASQIPNSKGSLAGTRWTIGGADGASNYIQVITHAIEYTVGGNTYNQNFPATGSAEFNLVVPPKPDFPNTNWTVYNLTASNPVFSPGNPLFTYDAATNPANDGLKDDTNLSFTIPDGSNLGWRLAIADGATTVREWSGHLGVGVTPYTSAAYNFNGLNTANALVATATETKALTATLYITPDPMGDPGYEPPPANIYPNITVTLDNTNPKLITGTGTTIDSQRKITLSTGTPVVTETQNTLSFTVYTNEALTSNHSAAEMWQVAVKKSDNTVLMNGANPVTATITNVTPSADFKTFNIQATINNLAGTLTNENTVLIVKMPWDSASNPGRYNSPEYPYNADMWNQDSAEYYLSFHVLDGKPRIEEITFEHRGVIGKATYNNGTWNTALDQSWVGNTIASPAAAQNYTIVAKVSGGAYRAMSTTWTADLRPLLGTAAANASVVPTSSVAPAGNPNESRLWTLTWTGSIPAAISNAWTNNQSLTIPINIVTQDGANPIAHSETQSIVIKVDKAAPTVSTTATSILADGTAKAYNLTVADTNGSGVYWDTVVGNAFNFVGENLTLNPTTDITKVDTGNGTYTLAIATATAVKHFQATYTVIDKMGNSVTYNRYLNVDPVPNLHSVSVNAGASHFVPGTDLVVTWSLDNAQRATGGTLALTSSIAVTGGSVTLSAAQLQAGTYTFVGFYNNNTALDGRTLTATVTGYTTGYTDATSSTTSNRNFTYNGNTNADAITVDVKPVINSVTFKQGTATINTLVPTMTNLTIEAVATTTNNLNTTDFPMSIAMVSPAGTLTGLFTLNNAPTIVANGTTRTYTWTGVDFTNLGWTPDSDIKVARFHFNTRTIYGYQAAQYMHDMAVLKNPVTLIQGKVGSRVAYTGTDPDGWFAPEHFLHTEYTFVTTVDQANPPIVADFDQVEDNITANWRAPLAVGANGSTKTTLTQSLVRGIATSSTINANAYKYMAKWVITPDVQSVWHAYNEGDSVPLAFDYVQMTGNVVDNTRSIKVDKAVPEYDNQLWIATGTTTPGSYQPLQNGFPGASPDISIALDPQTGNWPTNQKIYLKYVAMDGAGAGAMNIVTPTNPTGWTVAEVSHTLNAANGTAEKVISLTPNTPGNVNSLSTLALTLGTVQDKVGHVNYGTPANSTDPNWISTPPVLTFNFRADYATTHELLRAYKYWGVNTEDGRQDWHTAPYVKAGDPIGVMLKLNPVTPDRGTNVQSIAVSSVELNTRYITNVTGGTDAYVTMAYDAVDGVYYLNSDRIVNTAYAHGAGISMQYRINYLITYTDNTTSVPAPYVSGVIPNVGIVDKNLPEFIFNGTPTNPLNQRSVFVWSGSIGSGQEGYVVPGDNDGVIKLIFTDNSGYENTNTTPVVNVSGLNNFVTGMPVNYTVPAALLTYHPSYSLNVRNTTYTYTNVWVASLENLPIFAQVPPQFSATMGYQISDVVGNGPISGNRFVEIAANGPIVPIIRHAELVTTVPGTGTDAINYIAQTVPATMKVYIDAEYSAYIEDVWIDASTGVAFGAKSAPVALDHTDPLNHGARWLVTIPVTPNSINTLSNINFNVHTKRNPFGGTLFTGSKIVPVIVDGKDYLIGATTVTGTSIYGQTPNMIGPEAGAIVTAEFNNIGELVVDNGVQSLPAAIESWFTLQNTATAAFGNIPVPTLAITGNDVVATWTFTAADINQALAAGVSQLNINFKYKNIWGFEKTSANISFNIDKVSPVISTNGIKFYTGTTVSQTNSYNASSYIANNQNWTSLRFELNDPALRVNVPGSGINNANISIAREAETYTPTPDPLANMTASYNVAGYVELAFNPGFSAFDLAEGFYNITVNVEDNLENANTYVQRLLYWHHPSQMQIVPANLATVNVLDTNGAITDQQITAFPYDNNGQVQGVEFFLYQDVNNNSSYQANVDLDRTADFNNSVDGNPDMQAPYTVMWNLNAPHYKYLVDATYGRNNTRKFLVRAASLSEGARAVSDSMIVINVKDNQAPVPNVPTVNGNTTFNYITPALNVLNLSTTFDAEWIDAEWATFVVRKGATVVATIPALVVGGVADTTWTYNGQTPGVFTVSVTGKDFVGNVSSAVSAAQDVVISNPASLITYNMSMTNVLGFNNEPAIANGTVYGANNPASAVGNLRLDAEFLINDILNPLNPLNGQRSLEGISAVTFKAKVKNNITGAESVINVINNTLLQPDYPASGPIAVTPQIINNTITIFVPDNFYMAAGYDTQDISYDFFIELTPTDPAVLQDPVYSQIRLDYFAPRVAITENTPNITWSQNNMFKVTGDISDINSIEMLWSRDNTTWYPAHDLTNNPIQAVITLLPDAFAQFDNWNTAGGSMETLLDYAGPVYVKVKATDALGNIRESIAVQPFIDNVSPSTPVTHVAYRTHPDVEAAYPAGTFANLHTLGSLTGETANSITMVTSTENYGSSNLRLYVNPSQITNLSSTNIGANHAWNNMASWYTGTNDFRPPVRLYHGYSTDNLATNPAAAINWTAGALYDHMPQDGLYGFDVPSTLVQASGYHYFILASNDTRGNMEGDQANNGLLNGSPIAPLAFNGILSYEEMVAAIDLTVNVINIADVKVEIVQPTNNAIVGEWLNISADITSNAGNVAVNNVIFQRKVGNAWTNIATVASSASSNLKFHLKRIDIPDYDGLPYVPGVHLYANGVEKGELLWNETTGSWENEFSFAQGNYNFEYYLDLNNDGVINQLDVDTAVLLGSAAMHKVLDPNGFTSCNVTPWVTKINTVTISQNPNEGDGLYEFRAVPVDATNTALFNYNSPSTWLHIDNKPPTTTVDVIGGVDRIRVALNANQLVPEFEVARLVADVEELLVATDDIVNVVYQYSPQIPGVPSTLRRWVDFASSSTMGGNYQTQFMIGNSGGILAPLYDNIDNDADGLVDEEDEAEATYYVRAVAHDVAGNYSTSNTIVIAVDGAAPLMQVISINSSPLTTTMENNIFTIPATGDVLITAENITNTEFDAPVAAYFEYIYRSSQSQAWSVPQPFDAANVWQNVTAGSASQILPSTKVREGYYGFRAVARDILQNIDIAATPYTYVIFDDVNGSSAHITSVGSKGIISGEYAFAQAYTAYDGAINVSIDDPALVNTLTYKWSENLNGPWTIINTVNTNSAANVSENWVTPDLTRSPYIYLQVTAQDIFGNNVTSTTAKLYVDTLAPGAAVVSLTHNVESVFQKKNLNQLADINITLNYTNLPDPSLIDVANATVRIIKNDGTKVVFDNNTFTQVNDPAHATFQITANEMLIAGLNDGIYKLEIELVDFAGNASAIIMPADYQVLYIDTTAPVYPAMALTSTTHPTNVAPYFTDTIGFRVNYTDLIGLAPTGALSATITYMNATDVVNTYTLEEDANGTWINFSWNPSPAFEQYFTNGAMSIQVSANITVKDLLNHESAVPNTAYFFTLTYGVPNTTRLMAVRDYYRVEDENGNVQFNPQTHYVDWNLATPQVVEMVGTNQTVETDPANPPVRMPLKLYAYVAHQSDIPDNVEFYYQKPDATWQLIGSDAMGQQWQFVHPTFLAQFSREYTTDWNVFGLPTGDYNVKTVSYFDSGISEKTVVLHIFNNAIVPNFSIAGMMNNQVERGETYTFENSGFNAMGEFATGVYYKYRYVDPANGNSPISVWQHFGDAVGTGLDAWIPAPYNFDWTVYPYYLYNNRVQIVAHAIDKWGTETPIASALSNATIANIVNTQAPAILSVIPNWNGIDSPAIINANVNANASIKTVIETAVTPEDLLNVKFFHKLSGAADYTLFDTKVAADFTVFDADGNLHLESALFAIPTDPAITGVDLQVQLTDIFGNTNVSMASLVVDNAAPTANLVVTMDATVLTDSIERGTTVMLNANPADAPAGIQSVAYAYAMATVAPAVPAWMPLQTVVDAPYTYEWDVPADLIFGATYLVNATVTDAVGNVTVVERSFTITDHTTDLEIISVNNSTPVNNTILGNLHGDIPVVVTVNDPSIPRVEYLVREVNTAIWTSVKFVNVAGNDASTSFGDLLNAMNSGSYYLGVRPAQARRSIYPVMADSVMFTLDNTMAAITLNSSVPAANGYFNGDSFMVNFTVNNNDEIQENAIALEYALPMDPTNWMPLVNATIVTPNGADYVANFQNVAIPVDGFYNFRINVLDMAVPNANIKNIPVATNVLFDSGAPVVTMMSINGETDLTMPIDVELGTVAAITATSYDVVGGQIHVIASDIAKVEFYNGAEMIAEIMPNVATPNTYTFNWNTLGMVVNTTHQIKAIAYDNAGNTTATGAFQVNIVAPQVLEAYALITAMEFDPTTSNQDYIYAVVKDWPNTGNAPTLAFEYFNGTAWIPFADATDMGAYYRATFNAELMTNVTMLRGVVNGNHLAPMPQLAVSYNEADASLIVTDPAISAAVYYNHQLRVMETSPADPIVTTIQGSTITMAQPYTMNNNQIVDITVINGKNTYWAAVKDAAGNMQLNKTEVTPAVAGNIAEHGISVAIPTGGYAYFQNVMPAMDLPAGFTALNTQHSVFVYDNVPALVNRDITITPSVAPAAMGTIVAFTYDGQWSAPIAVTDNENGTYSFNAATGTIIALAQYTGVTINTMFTSITPDYVAPNTNLWTTDMPTIEFLVYEGMDANGYIIPQVAPMVQMYLDNMEVPVTYNMATGIATYTVTSALSAGTHSVRLVATTLDGFISTPNPKTFYVDVTAPVITATGSQLNQTLRAISANITDPETGIHAYTLNLQMGAASLSIPSTSISVTGNAYNYNLTDEDLYNLGYNFSTTAGLTAIWTAENNLVMGTNAVSADYTVNIVAPGIVFTGFADGWWINPTANTALTFDVIAPAGRTIQDNLQVVLSELINDPVNGNYSNQIQTMSLTPVSVNGNVYSYSLNFGYAVAPNAHAVKLAVTALDSYNVTAMSSQTYGIDYLAPVMWALAPVGNAIDPDAFPVVYEPAVLPYGTNVAIGVAFQDIQGFTTLETGEWWYDAVAGTYHNDYLVYYTGASGIKSTSATVTLNGTPIANGTITNGSFSADAGMLNPGTYTVIATVSDNAGNVGSLSYTFTITGGAPTITFDNVADGWLNSTVVNTLGFSVTSQNTIAAGGVVANVYTVPANVLIVGPVTPTPTGANYSVTLPGGIIPVDQTGIRLEVMATDIYGGYSTSNQAYGIDNIAPVISMTSPAENANYTMGTSVNITASISDQTTTKLAEQLFASNNTRSGKAGSGIGVVMLSVIAPNGENAFEPITYEANTQVVAKSFTPEQYGQYVINLMAVDMAENQSMVSRTIMVGPASGPSVNFNEIAGGWLNATGINSLGFTIDNVVPVSVSANVIVYPSEAVLMGPLAVNHNASGLYTVAVNGAMIPADQNTLRLQVMVSDSYGNTTEANQYYSVDKIAPTITFLSPANGAEITMVDETTTVRIEANFSDWVANLKNTKGSGIASSRLVVIDPMGAQVGAAVETTAGITETLMNLNNLMLGTYVARITVIDNAGNQAMASVNFTVVAAPLPPVALEITEAYIYPNPVEAELGARFNIGLTAAATVNVTIYDFAGREVRTMLAAAKTTGKATVQITFDGKNNDGVKLARGSYFARVSANDGKKIVEKVVKIAIKK